MRKKRLVKRVSKGFVSVLLVLSVMLSLVAPFNLTAFAAEEPATGDDIYALVYDIRANDSSSDWSGYELVIQRGNTPDPDVTVTDASAGVKRRVWKKTYSYSEFGVPTHELADNQAMTNAPWSTDTPKSLWNNNYDSSANKLAQLFAKITIKDEIKPESIAGWFYNCGYAEINGLEKIDTSICTDMRYAFYNLRQKVKKLDLHTFDTSNVQKIDNFIYSYGELEEVDVSGFDLSKVKSLTTFIKGGYYTEKDGYVLSKLNKVNFSGMDISKIEEIKYFLTYTKDLEEITFDLNPRNAKGFLYAFQHNRGLKKFTFGSEGHLVQPGVDRLVTSDGERLVKLNNMFEGCTALEEVDFEYLDLPDYKNTASTEYDANDYIVPKQTDVFSYSRTYEYAMMFKDCKSLTDLKHIENLFIEAGNCGNWTHRYMFDGCESLETLDLSKIHAYIGGPGIFRNCKSLKTLNLINLGTAFQMNNWFYSHNLRFQSNVNPGEEETNIFEGCTELSEVYLSPYYPPAANTILYKDSTVGCGNSCPPVDRDWVKVEWPYYYPDQYGSYRYAVYDGSKTDYKTLSEVATPTATGDPKGKDTEELFTEFKPEFAGRWVAVSKLNLKGNGGTPSIQQIKGAIGMTVDYKDGEITEPIRNGYHFTGWYSNKKNGEGTKLEKGEPAAAWTYYAHWDDNHYTLKLNGNGGKTEKDGETVTEYTAADNLAYSDFYELSSKLFTREGYILSGWNTRPNGAGDEYTANDSVNKLTSADGGEVTLYAQWHKPDFILTFDSQGGSAVDSRDYTLTNDPENPTQYGALAESAREGYTFLGWYTEAEGGVSIKSTAAVDPLYATLYAHWAADPMIVFNANGYDTNHQPVAYFNNNSTQHTLPKRYKYNQNLGVLPTPQYGSAVLKGWYTAPTGGTAVTSATPATADTTYYAQWGYRPQFETNGGTYTDFPTFEVQESPEYTITTLPAIKKENCTFDGWYLNNKKLNDKDKVDLSSGSVIEARWSAEDLYDVTLDANGGSLTGTAKSPIKVYGGNKIGELPSPTRSGYDFLGWYNGSTRYTYESVINSNVTLTAQWAEQNRTVTFDAKEGKLYDPADATRKVRDNGTITDLPGANRSDSAMTYSFDGWFYMDGEEEKQLKADTAITKDIDCYAKWTASRDRFEEAKDKLYSYTVKWNTPSNEYATNIDDNLVVAPQSGNSALSVMLFAEFDFNNTVSGTLNETLAPYSVKILVPKYAFKNSSEVGIGSNNINAGLTRYVDDKSDSESSDFVYKDNDPDYPNYYVITNNDEINGKNQTQMFRITYDISPSEIRSVNGGYTDDNGYFSGIYYQATLPVKVLVDRDKDGDYTDEKDTEYTKDLGIEMHTDVKSQATKVQAAADFEWDNSWGNRPDDADQYFYITWTLMSVQDPSSSQKFKISWNENTYHDGSVVLIRPDTAQLDNEGDPKYLEKGTFRTTVVTKHTRRPSDTGWKSINNEAILDVEYLSGYHDQVRVSGTAGVYLLPEGDLQYEKYIKDYTRGASTIKNGAQDMILARQPVDHLPFEIAYREYKNTDNATWNDTTKRYNTPERNIIITDGAKGSSDVVLSTVKGPDRYTWGASTEKALSDSDYCFDSLTVYMTEYDAVKVKTQVQGEDKWEWSEPYAHKSTDPEHPYIDYTDVEIWIRTEGENDFKLFKTIRNSDLSETNDDVSTERFDERETYGAVYADVALPAKTVGYQVKHKSEFFTTKLFVVSDMRLNSSNKVLSAVREDVADGYNTLIKNNCTLDISVWNSSMVTYTAKSGLTGNQSKDTQTGGASICAYELAIGNSYICADKRCQKVETAQNAGNYGVTVTSNYEEFPGLICGWGYTDTEGAVKLIESGEFNDLLPYNFTVDKDSVYVVPIIGNIDGKANNTIGNYIAVNRYNTKKSEALPSAYYSVDFHENWEGSGRTMMTIKVNTPDNVAASGYYAFYKMKTSIANISANGLTQSNYVSFTDTTENQSPPIAKAGNISTIDAKFAPYYQSIDNQYTAFAKATTDMALPSAYATGIKSAVKSEGEFVSRDVTVGLDSDYTYNVTFTNSQPANNIVIYDVLGNGLDGQVYDWNGTFNAVDVSSLTTDELISNSEHPAHMAPEVWYCIKSGDPVESDLDIERNPTIWTKTVPADKSTVKAIAVDCRRDENGEDYWLKPEVSISFNINMHSPVSHPQNNVYTYNEAHVYGSITGEPFHDTTLTSVLLHYATPELHKTSFPESGADADHRTGVVNKSVIEYSLEITNPDDSVSVNNVVIEDVLDSALTINNMPQVKLGDEDPIAISKAAMIESYEVTEENGIWKFTATVSSLAPGQTITIIVPATVNAALDAPIDNTATITRANGQAANIQSETTYHYVTVTQAKIKKVNAKGEGLEGAALQIFENNSTNWDASTGKLKDGAAPKEVTINGSNVTQFTSAADVITFNLEPGDYILHEESAPETYKTAADIPFTIDIEGITHVDGAAVNYVEMVDEPAYKIIFHENKPNGSIDDKNKVFRIYEPGDLKENKVVHFYDIPEWAEDEYVFAGWYHSNTYKSYANAGNITQNVTTASNFENDTFTGKNTVDNDSSNDDYHLYAKWISVGTVSKDKDDANLMEGDYRGFGLAGVQIRNPEMHDSNYENVTPGGMRFVTSLSEDLLSNIDALSDNTVDTEEGHVGVEYGYAVGTEENIKAFTSHYGIAEPTKYQLQYNGSNVNGKNTTGEERTADTDFRYITNVNCTRGTTNSNGKIKDDHRNFTDYRLYTLVVTYEGDSASKKGDKIDARAYIRYYDANGKLRVFYNTYKKSMYGGCLCSFNQVAAMAIPQDQAMLEEQQKSP
ncbi:InlB B-repeat-containing protein [Ruminococcus sp.]|uniref:InlB B-repeat-containing protein n=1 Tax=Ruminococcus sp. TaxID=41978 RepID=UPI0038651303